MYKNLEILEHLCPKYIFKTEETVFGDATTIANLDDWMPWTKQDIFFYSIYWMIKWWIWQQAAEDS